MTWRSRQENLFHSPHNQQPAVSPSPSSPIDNHSYQTNHCKHRASESPTPPSPHHSHLECRQRSSESRSPVRSLQLGSILEPGEISPTDYISMLRMQSPATWPPPVPHSPTLIRTATQRPSSTVSTNGHHHHFVKHTSESVPTTSRQLTSQPRRRSIRKGDSPTTGMRPPRGTPKGPLPIQDQICLLKSVLRHDPFNCPIRRTSQVWEIIGREQGIRARTCARRYDNIIQASISGRQFQTGGNSGIVGGNATGAAAAVKGTEEQIATKNSLLEQLFTMMNQPQALIRMQKKKRYRSEDADRRLLKEIIRLNPFGQRVGQVAKAWEDVRDALGMKVHSRQCIRRVNRMIKPYQVRDRMYSGKIPEAMREENDDLIKEVIELMKLAGQQGEGEEEEGEEEGGGEEEDDGGSGNGGQDEEDDSMTGSASEYDDQEEGSVHTQSPPTVHRFEEKVEDRRVQHIKSDDSAAHLHSPKVNQLREDLSPQTWTSPQQTPDDNFKSRHSPPHTSEPIQQTSSAPRLPRLPILSHLRDTLEQSKRSSDSHHPYARVTRSQDWSSPRHRIVLPSPTSRQDKVDDHREGTRSSIASTTSADHPLWTQTQWSYPASERNPDDCLDRILLEIRTIHTSLGRMESQQQRDRDHRRSINMTILQFRDQLDQQQQQIQAMQRQLQSSQPYSHPDLGLRHPLDYNPHLKRFHREDDSSNFSSVSHEGPYRDQSS